MYISLYSLVGGWFGVRLVRKHEGDCDMVVGIWWEFLRIWYSFQSPAGYTPARHGAAINGS